MRYLIEYSVQVKYQLRELEGLSREGRIKLFATLDHLRDVTDDYRTDPANRSPDYPNRLTFGILLQDRGHIRHFVFAVDDASAVAGVLRILSVEDAAPPPSR